MMKTALSIVQDFCYRANLPAPAALYGSTDTGVLQLKHCLYAACQRLRAARCFPQQKRVHTFSTVVSTAQYSLPDDYYSPLLETDWNQSEDEQLIGPVSDEEFTGLLHSGAPSTVNYTYRIFGPEIDTLVPGQIWLSPTPASIQTLSFEYITRNLFLPPAFTLADTTPHETVDADTWLCLFDYDLASLGLEAEYLKQKGGDTNPAEDAFVERIEAATNRILGARKGSFVRKWAGPRYRVASGSWSF